MRNRFLNQFPGTSSVCPQRWPLWKMRAPNFLGRPLTPSDLSLNYRSFPSISAAFEFPECHSLNLQTRWKKSERSISEIKFWPFSTFHSDCDLQQWFQTFFGQWQPCGTWPRLIAPLLLPSLSCALVVSLMIKRYVLCERMRLRFCRMALELTTFISRSA